MTLSPTEENYLKCIYKLVQEGADEVSTNSVAAGLNTTAASVTDMLKKLGEKGLVDYVRYKGVRLTPEGARHANQLVRKHRLWEVFLVDKLHFQWDEVHDIAEQLEHIQSPLLIQRLDEYLGFPRFDPHGDPIPDQFGNYSVRNDMPLSDLPEGGAGVLVGVRDHSVLFLQYLSEQQLTLGARVQVLQSFPYDGSFRLRLFPERELTVSKQVAKNLLVTRE